MRVRYHALVSLALGLLVWILAGPQDPENYLAGIIALASSLLAVSYLVRVNRAWHRGYVIGILAIGLSIGLAVTLADSPSAQLITFITLCLVGFICPYLIIRGLWERKQIDVQLLFGAISLYLLIGICFGAGFALVDITQSDPLFIQNSGLTNGSFRDKTYFSFVTLSTTGYGDFAPHSGTTRALAITESITGQLYLIIALATIVSLLGQKQLIQKSQNQ